MTFITKTVEELIISDGLRTFPYECCGFLLGNEKNGERIIDELIVVDNAKEGDKRRRFEISPLDYLKAEQYAESNNLTLLGVYHSHPNHPSVPSEHDRLAAQPFFSYIIVSIHENEFVSIQSWRLNNNFQFEEEKIKTIDKIFQENLKN